MAYLELLSSSPSFFQLFIQFWNSNLQQLMGLEDCNSGDDDEECAKRRMVAEAHLDYIYTQHRKP